MTFRHFLMIMTLATIAVWGAWVYVVSTIDPITAGAAGFIFFHLTFSVAMIGTLTMIGTGVRRIFRNQDLVSRQVSVSFRQASLLSILLVGALLLLGKGLLNTWNMIFLILALTLLELAFLLSRHPRARESERPLS